MMLGLVVAQKLNWLNVLIRERASASGWRCEKTLDNAPKTTIATDGSAFG